ncbi:MAG: 2-succinyl-5-enolpyruvyl-6-hydroxy-3-cyclohexene-1-carboxylic-acid synthase, partial [Muribaculaceae bacterium]|nr:2-succinyl-5-enolpyruvyl-6-hydroxy-3-cyclohexene-1-carboxylic-acid synthase [Muribaculaceae bacterium]
MKDTDNLYCRILLDVLREHGVKDIVASPGTRNAPLLISCSYREEFKTQVISDERNAAFVALGLSVVSK